ncbi:MAG: DUF6119 family protein [Polyangiaceae bacterium]
MKTGWWRPAVTLRRISCLRDYHRGHRYVLSNQKWYRVDDTYLRRVDARLRAVPGCAQPAILPWPRILRDGKLVHHEEDYNRQYLQKSDFLVLDRKPFAKFGRAHGRSKVEIADLFHLRTKKLFCVKRWNGSSTMSHLLAQASVSAQLLRMLPAYANELVRQVQRRWPSRSAPANAEDFLQGVSFVYVIGTKHRPKDCSLDMLPVFTKVNMAKHLDRLQGAHFTAEICWTQML